MGKIFISYRREESEGYAGRLFDGLKEHFGQEHVFMDVIGIESGADFVEALNNALGSCSVLISVIGKSWLSIAGATGNRRLDDPQDFIRLETKIALERACNVSRCSGISTSCATHDLFQRMKNLYQGYCATTLA